MTWRPTRAQSVVRESTNSFNVTDAKTSMGWSWHQDDTSFSPQMSALLKLMIPS